MFDVSMFSILNRYNDYTVFFDENKA